jgi:hypothetical protein
VTRHEPEPDGGAGRRRVRNRRRRPRPSADPEGSYVCPTCGEAIVVPLDPSAGDEQQYVEDCPVCCNPNVVHVEFFGLREEPRVWAEAE